MASSKKENNTEQPSWLEQKLIDFKKTIIMAVFLILIVTIILLIVSNSLKQKQSNMQNLQQTMEDLVHGEEGKVTTISQATLVKIVTTGKLYTAEYPYNGIAAVYDGDTLKYHVAYEGTVKAGIDASKILLHLDEEKHEIIIRLPAVEVAEPTVNAGTLDYIFEKNQYNTETVAQEAYKAAIADLKNKVAADPGIKQTAAKTAKMYEKAFVEPLVEQMDPDHDYTVVVLEQGEAYQ